MSEKVKTNIRQLLLVTQLRDESCVRALRSTFVAANMDKETSSFPATRMILLYRFLCDWSESQNLHSSIPTSIDWWPSVVVRI